MSWKCSDTGCKPIILSTTEGFLKGQRAELSTFKRITSCFAFLNTLEIHAIHFVMQLLSIVTLQKCIANIKTLCKYRGKSINYSLYVLVFQCFNLQYWICQTSSDLWIIWSIANKNKSIFSSLKKSRNWEITTAAVIQSERAVVGGTKT